MDASLLRARAHCPAYNIEQDIVRLFDMCTFDDPMAQLPSILCPLAESQYVIGYFMTKVLLWLVLFRSVVGSYFASLALVALGDETFRSDTFLYHKALFVGELVRGLFQFLNFHARYHGGALKGSAFWAYYSAYFFEKQEISVSLFVDLCAVWSSLQIAFGLTFPHAYRWINSRLRARTFLIVVALIATAVHAPTTLQRMPEYNESTSEYRLVPTELSTDVALNHYFEGLGWMYVAESILLTIAALASVYSLARTWSDDHNERGSAAANTRRRTNMIRSVCQLQLAISIPLLANYLVLAFALFNRFERDPEKLVTTMSFEDAKRQVDAASLAMWLIPINHIIALVVQCFQFFAYVACSAAFRAACSAQFRHPGYGG